MSCQSCSKPSKVRGFCLRHYQLELRRGMPLLGRRGPLPIRTSLPKNNGPSDLAQQLGISRQRADQLLNRQKRRARLFIMNGIRAGRIRKPERCERCSLPSPRLEGHHPDYNKPLEVIWVCPPCHSIIHPHFRKAKFR